MRNRPTINAGLRLKRGITAIALAFAVSVPALAHEGATGVVKQRMDMMGDVGKAMKTIGQMIKGETAFNGAVASDAAAEIAKHAVHFPEIFPEGSTEKPSEALPAIWENWEEFLAIFNQMKSDADALAELAGNASGPEAIKAQFGLVGRSCGTCHEKFRLKKQ